LTAREQESKQPDWKAIDSQSASRSHTKCASMTAAISVRALSRRPSQVAGEPAPGRDAHAAPNRQTASSPSDRAEHAQRRIVELKVRRSIDIASAHVSTRRYHSTSIGTV
jgi:hypothetical protein